MSNFTQFKGINYKLIHQTFSKEFSVIPSYVLHHNLSIKKRDLPNCEQVPLQIM